MLPASLLLAGCGTTATARKVVPLESYQHIYVEEPANENHHVDEFLAAELRKMGRDASSGPLTMMPDNTDAVLTYRTNWSWDFRNYLLELDVELFTARTHKKLADARYYQPTPRAKPPESVAHAVVTKLFAKT
jgi:hypothetical protein